ncbi:MAG: GNAT family N-acetyltransferase [Oscillospiraceae bacterium]|nr:GNAT family N-acetyltransferase [Oscillospiraceae bacterium]
MQRTAFSGLLARYRDEDTSPANEPLERIEAKLKQDTTHFYFIFSGDDCVGAVRAVVPKDGGRKRIAPIFIMEEHRGRGLAQAAIKELERIHGEDNWELDTILQEAGNCYLYEKMGYVKTGVIEKINDRMDIVYYEKKLRDKEENGFREDTICSEK